MATRLILLMAMLLVILISSLACNSSSDAALPSSTHTAAPAHARSPTYTPFVHKVPSTAYANRLTPETSVEEQTLKPSETTTPGSKSHAELSTSTSSKAFELGLPFSAEYKPLGMMPLGETINHDPPRGHPGMDFQWPYQAEIIVAVDGIVGDIQEDVNPFDGKTIYNLTIISGKYGVSYEVIDLDALNPGLGLGDHVESGRVLGHSQRASKDDPWTMIHWAFGIAREADGRPNPEGVIERYFVEWLCPMPYFSASERERLLLIWNEAAYQHKNKFPEICNGYYKD